jgi:cytochrome c peroxidase
METSSPDLVGAFRSPSLRGLADRAPFMHSGQFATLAQLLDHYNRAPTAAFGRSELKPLGLSEKEIAEIAAFLRALSPDATEEDASSGTMLAPAQPATRSGYDASGA